MISAGNNHRSSTDGGPVGDGLSRRLFLALTGALTAGAGIAVSGVAGAVEERPPERVVLSIDDLLGGEEYVEWTVDAAEAPLSLHLDGVISGFDAADGTTAGFVATARSDGPTIIESALFAASAADSDIVDAIDDWVDDVQADAGTGTPLGDDAVEWVSVSGLTAHVIRVDHLPGSRFAITSARGDVDAELAPRSAVAYYADIVRTRATRHLEQGVEK